MITDFRHACVVVKDLKKSLRFYRDILGFKVYKIITIKGKYPETVLNIKGIRLTYAKMRSPHQSRNRPAVFELHHWQNPRISPKSGYNHVSFTVKDIDSEYKRLTRLRVRFISKPTKAPDNNTKICFGYDPDNNLIEFVQDLHK